MKKYFVYILTNKLGGVLYIGRTENLVNRMTAHKAKSVSGFSQKYNLNKLVYFEVYENAEDAAIREKRMKAWKRQWKIDLIEKENPQWGDLSLRLNE